MIDLTRKKKTLPIKLQNGKVINIYPPRIKLLGDLAQTDVNNADISVICEIVSTILSNNAQKYKVPQELISDLDMEDLRMVIDGITAFTSEITNSKN